MLMKYSLAAALVIGFALTSMAQEGTPQKPKELEVLKASLGVWDAQVEVWPDGPDAPSIQFKGVETNRAYGEYWIASDFDSEFMGQTTKLHSIVGYDLDKRSLVGMIIDHGPYAASLVGKYDQESKTVHWTTQAKDLNGQPLVQQTSVTQKSVDERVLTMSIPDKEEGDVTKFMQIRFRRRK